MEKYLKLCRSLVVVVSFLLSALWPAYGGGLAGHNKKVPVGKKVNKIINSFLPQFAANMNRIIKEGPNAKDLNRLTAEDQRIYKALMAGLKKRNASFVARGNVMEFYSTDGKSQIKLLDYIKGKFLVDGKVYTYKRNQSFKANLIEAGELFHKRSTSVYQKFFNLIVMDEAHAALPLLVIPGWVWLTGAAAGGVSFFADTSVSAGANDIANNPPDVREAIRELTTIYEERANTCEADLGQARVQPPSLLISNNAIRTVGALIEGLGAELEDTFMDMDGKDQINYNDFGCEAHDGKDGIRNRQIIGAWSGFRPHGEILRGLCDHQERLNRCFAATEEVMRENDIRINDLSGPDRVGPYEGVVDDYIEMRDASSR